ncbi:MAG: hypothetical protein IKW39_00605, partial [Alphaproteobacteria bacterium]|nr:hypothetical protein [Alphaproteobacteria bacterium]
MAKSEKENTNSTANTFLKALALSIGLSSSGMAEATSHPTKDIEPQKTEISHTPNKDNQYTTTIKLRNDSIKFMQGTHGYYTGQNGGEIRIIKADMSMDSFGYKSYKPHEELLIIHERQHQIDVEQKGVGASPVSLEEEYHRSIHMEVGARIAEL